MKPACKARNCGLASRVNTQRDLSKGDTVSPKNQTTKP